MKKRTAFLVVVMFVFSLLAVACGGKTESNVSPSTGGGETITLKVGHVAPAGHSYDVGINEFAKAVEEATKGKVKLEIYGNGQLGGERDMTEQIQLGTLDMGLITSGPVGNFVPELSALEMPFLFRDLDHVYKTLDGDIGKELEQKMEAAGFKVLGFWENGFRHLSNNKKEIRSPADLKGLKMRTVENDIFVATYRALGADPTPIAFPEVYTSFQQGVVDGFDASYGVFESTRMYEVQKYFSEVGIYYASAVLIMNKDKFASLPADIQETLYRLGHEYAVKQRKINQDMEKQQKESVVAKGVKVVEAGEVDINAFREAVKPVYEQFGSRFGDLVKRIQDVK